MSTTTNLLIYSISSGLEGTTPGGTQFTGNVSLEVLAASDFTDADLFAIQEALAAAFPMAWGVTIADFSVSKNEQEFTAYVTDATATPPTFS